MKNKNRYLPGLLIVAIVWLGLTLSSWFLPLQDVSISERRKLEQLPALNFDSILSGKFALNFEKFSLDQFPFRDSFRRLKAISTFYVFLQKDNNDIYIADGYAAKLEYPLNEKSVISAADKFTALYNKYMKEANNNIYLSIVPDKGYFLADANKYPALDYEKMFEIMQSNLDFAEYIDITDKLDITDYYTTDTHWRQEEIIDVSKKIAEAMGVTDAILWDYSRKTANEPFYGVYYGQSALPLKSEQLHYLTNPILAACTVYNVETDEVTELYNIEKLAGYDPYEMYLSGAAPILYIENSNAKSNRELIVFRDSFGSSLVPLLAEGYQKTTVIDTRYIDSNLIGNYVTFNNQDVLFLYSTLILNNSSTLK